MVAVVLTSLCASAQYTVVSNVDFPTDNDQDLPLSKEYHISYERRAIGYHVEIV